MPDAVQWLPLLNLLLVPAVGLLLRVAGQLERLEATQRAHGADLDKLAPVLERIARMEAVQAMHAQRLNLPHPQP